MQIRILSDVRVERFQIREALRPRDLQHLAFNLRDTLQAELMNLLGREIGRRLLPHRKAIARLAIRQRPRPRIHPPMRRVVLAYKLRELGICRRHFVLHRALKPFAEPFPIRFRDRIRELLQRSRERTLFQRTVRNLLRLRRHFLQQIFRRHQVIAEPVAHMPGRLLHHPRDLPQPRPIVFIVLHVAKRSVERQRGVSQVNAAKLGGRHFPALELRPFHGIAQAAHHQRLVQFLLLRKSGCIEGFEEAQCRARMLDVLRDGLA